MVGLTVCLGRKPVQEINVQLIFNLTTLLSSQFSCGKIPVLVFDRSSSSSSSCFFGEEFIKYLCTQWGWGRGVEWMTIIPNRQLSLKCSIFLWIELWDVHASNMVGTTAQVALAIRLLNKFSNRFTLLVIFGSLI